MIYQPAEDSYLLEKVVKKLAKNKIFLDMGSGSGIQSRAALQARAKSILATDVDAESIRHLKSQNISVIRSNLFSNLKGKKFDLIAFNPPYLPRDSREDSLSQIITTGGEKGDELSIEFLKQAKSHLNKDGKILLLFSSLTPKDKILKIIKKRYSRYRIVAEEKLFMERLEVWQIEK